MSENTITLKSTHYKKGNKTKIPVEFTCINDQNLENDKDLENKVNKILNKKNSIDSPKLTILDFNKKESAGKFYFELKHHFIKKYLSKQRFITGKTKTGKMKLGKINTILIEPRLFGKYTIFCNIYQSAFQDEFDNVQDCIETIKWLIYSITE